MDDISAKLERWKAVALDDWENKIGSGKVTLPSAAEFEITNRWSQCAENFAVKTSIGTAVGLVGGLILLRGRAFPRFFVGLGAGCGAGSAFTSCQLRFERRGAIDSAPSVE